MDGEEWVAVPGYEGRYEVSSEGRVRATPNKRLRSLAKKNKGGYREVSLWDGTKLATFKLHRLVYVAFNGSVPEGLEVCHKDYNKDNNFVNNLVADTRSQNMRDRVNNGHDANKNKTHCPQKHPYSEENIYIYPIPETGGFRRVCKICIKINNEKRKEKMGPAAWAQLTNEYNRKHRNKLK